MRLQKKDVLTKAITETIPAGSPVALRVFGHRKPGACDTELAVPLAPLDPISVVKVIKQIQAKNLARTPIADSLLAVATDLRGVKGRSVVVLVTDGEETCDGDPARAIDTFVTKGADVSLNIVGFTIDDEALTQQFSDWAALGNGRYFAANNENDLQIALDQGKYKVIVKNTTRHIFERVAVPGGKAVKLKIE